MSCCNGGSCNSKKRATLLNLPEVADLVVGSRAPEKPAIKFGPNQQYTLYLAAPTRAEKVALINNLFTAATELKRQSDTDSRPLFDWDAGE